MGEITTSDRIPDPDPGVPLEVISFREIIGLQTADIERHLQTAREHLARVRAARETRIGPGISPHAPYSVHPDLFVALTGLARRESIPVAMHLAETPEELELLQSGSGPFRTFLQSHGLWDEDVFPGGRDIRFFLEHLATLPQSLIIHGNHLSAADLAFVTRHPNLAIVYCPRTHAHFRHRPHPWRDLIRSGARVVLGTDSRASSPDLNVWRDLQLAARQAPEILFPDLLKMVTTDAAAALGHQPGMFRITAGSPFRATVLDCSECDATSLMETVLHPNTCPLAQTDIGQRVTWRRLVSRHSS